MNVTDLIKKLEYLKEDYGDIEVMTSYDYGDSDNTEVLSEIENIKVVRPEESHYSRTGLASPPEGHDDNLYDEDGEIIAVLNENDEVIVLSYKEKTF